MSKIQKAARNFIEFVDSGPSPYHVVEKCKQMLVVNGFSELKEKESWNISPKGKYFVINNFSTIIAFAVGGNYKAGNGFSIVGAHTDSPCFRVKPRSVCQKTGYIGVRVQTYGGGIWHSWFDRDLKLAGRVVVKGEKGLVHRLVHIKEPVLNIPNLCVHLDREMHNKFAPNKETHMCPVLATVTKAEEEFSRVPSLKKDCSGSNTHHPVLLSLLSKELKCQPSDIVDFELCLADHQPATIGGALQEFIFAPRIDNLMNCYTGLQGLFESMNSLDSDTNVRMLALFDNEEVGSESAQGARSSILEWTMRRIVSSNSGTGVAFEESIPKSFFISADQAHAVHPNYPEKHESEHRPVFHGGIVLKYNANQRYTTTAITAAIVREVAKGGMPGEEDVPLQDFVVRNDSGCGSTIGPMVSANLGVRTVDIGTAQLSMHSIRETCCTSGVLQATTLYKRFFERFPKVDSSFTSE